MAFAASSYASLPSNFIQNFESGVADWDVFGPTYTPTQVASGTNGVTSAGGSYHATLTPGTVGATTNAATDFGDYTTEFPTGGFTTSLDIYLDLSAITQNDLRVNHVVAMSKPDGAHRRDFAFVIGGYDSTDLTGPGAGTTRFVINAQFNSGRGSSYPDDPSKSPIAISSTGWYTFEHTFYDSGAGVLAADLSIFDATATLVNSWTLSDGTDVIGSTIGGNRYGWVSANELGALAIDNSSLTLIPEPAGIMLLSLGGMALLKRQR
ncbi:MAG: hypothetical protein IT445_02245 [Phycisphaeraceae bacterium]|nr:hypothetical protein [Phycisphaeraceae bacterium]